MVRHACQLRGSLTVRLVHDAIQPALLRVAEEDPVVERLALLAQDVGHRDPRLVIRHVGEEPIPVTSPTAQTPRAARRRASTAIAGAPSFRPMLPTPKARRSDRRPTATRSRSPTTPASPSTRTLKC